MRSRVIITGGAGFIGSYLCERFLADNWDVLCIDNLMTGSKENIEHLLPDSRFDFVRHDIEQPWFADGDLVLNFACPASPVHYQDNPIRTVKTNVFGTMNMLGLAKRSGAVFLQASTSEVYGDPLEHPQRESYWGNVNPIGIRSCYDEGKRIAETLCFDYHRQHQLQIKVIRIFNTYGPRMAIDDGRVVSNFIVQALRGDPLTIYGEGTQTRSFCYVDDLVDGIFKFATLDSPETGPLNLGNDQEFTVAELAEKVLQLTQSKSKIIRKPLPPDDPKTRRPDLTRAKAALKWSPKTPLDEGLKMAIPWFRKALGK